MKIRLPGSRVLALNNDALRHPIDAMRGRLDRPAIELRRRTAVDGAPPPRTPPPPPLTVNIGVSLADELELERQLRQAEEEERQRSIARRQASVASQMSRLPRIEDMPPPRQLADVVRTASPLSPSLTAKFGCEMEVPGVEVSVPDGAPPPLRGTVLLERAHWKLETDASATDPGKYDLEVVFNPLSNEAQVREAMKEIVELFQSLRDKALESDSRAVSLNDIAPDVKGEYTVNVKDIHFGARLQSTYGIKLEDLDRAMEEVLTQAQVKRIREDTQAVSNHYAQLNEGEQLPPGARQFAMLINMYLVRAQSKLPIKGTVHVTFRMMSRTDFCSAYEKVLDPADRVALKWLLTTARGQTLPPFMQALGLNDPTRPVFAKPYGLPGSTDQAKGPTVKAWLDSIVNGRGDGRFKKDLMSPPPGIPLHTGDLSKDYGMGAMGVDEANGHLLFELRGAPYRPEKIPMNGQIVRAVLNELGHAAALNDTLDVEQRGPVESAKFDLLDRAENAYSGLLSMADTLASHEGTLNSRTWKILAKLLRPRLAELQPLRQALSARQNSTWTPALLESIDKVNTAANELLQAGEPWTSSAEVMAKLPALRTAVGSFEASLWEAGTKTH